MISENNPGAKEFYYVPQQPGFRPIAAVLYPILFETLHEIAFDLFEKLRRTKHPQYREGSA
jgi:hypothetical protein